MPQYSAIVVRMNEETLHIAEIVWEYMLLRQPVQDADCLLVLGSRDDRVAVYAAELSKRLTYSTVMVSGGISHTQDLLATYWGEETEAAHFSKIYRENGGRGDVILEDRARNTGDNAHFSYELLKSKGIRVESLLIITKPYTERRALSAFEAQWPDTHTKIRVSSMGGSLEDYCNLEQPFDLVVNIMAGDMQRILEYPKRHLQTPQDVPSGVMEAYQRLVALGYTHHLIF